MIGCSLLLFSFALEVLVTVGMWEKNINNIPIEKEGMELVLFIQSLIFYVKNSNNNDPGMSGTLTRL